MDLRYHITDWLPVTRKEVLSRGWDQLDVIIVSGDAYVDHPSFGTAVIGRSIEKEGYKVAIIAQPNWQDDLRDFKKFGPPRLFFGVTSGVMDSMVNHYTAHKRLRSDDAYTPGGKAGFRPDYAVTVYTRILKKLYPDVPVVIGGVEASLRRLTHYDYWSDQLKPSILVDSGADLLVYGMGDRLMNDILKAYSNNKQHALKGLRQVVYIERDVKLLPKENSIELASHEVCLKDKKAFARNFKHIEIESNKVNANYLVQKAGDHFIVVNPPLTPADESETDAAFDLPYTRIPHPKYNKKGSIPAYEMIRHSINIHRGCFGGCSFCTISAHQGKFISSRSEKSVLNELEKVTNMHDFKGYISDLGGPSANMFRMKGIDLKLCEKCIRPSCIYPKICHNLDTSHQPLTQLYRKVAANPDVKKVNISSGLRYDLFMKGLGKKNDPDGHDAYAEQLINHHISGRLKVAPEHTSERVLKLMRKPSFDLFYKLKKKFDQLNELHHRKWQLIPYFISSHPACEISDMADLAMVTKKLGMKLKQVQDFTPTPMTVATVIYYSGYHPYSLKKVYTARSIKEKKNQQRFFFWYLPENRGYVNSFLEKIK